jgi:hypothetical protein
MSTHAGPNIVESNLIFYLDPANSDCFGSGQTSATNIVSGGNVSGASGNPGSGTHTPDVSNFPSYSSLHGGIFDFSGGKGMNCDENLGGFPSVTISFWAYNDSSSTRYFFDGRNNGGNWFLNNYESYNINLHSALRFNFDDSYNASNPKFLNVWNNYVFSSNATRSYLYINGYEMNTFSSNPFNRNFGINFRVGTRFTTATATQWTGYMGAISFYSTLLDSDQVKQNFNALRSRYGI